MFKDTNSLLFKVTVIFPITVFSVIGASKSKLDEILFEYTIIQAEKFVENKAVDKMIEEFQKQRNSKNEN